MKNFTLSILIFFFSLILISCASSETEANSNDPKEDSIEALKYFRISNSGAHYEHKAQDSYHRLIAERARLYSMLASVSTEIEAVNHSKFAEKLNENKKDIGFCARFHIIFLILNRYSRCDSSASFTPFESMIKSLSGLEINEYPSQIVSDQFEAFFERVFKIIKEIRAKGGPHCPLADELKDFLVAETERIEKLKNDLSP